MSSSSTKPHPKSKFTPEEDVRLRSLVREYGANDWAGVAQRMPQRNERQCKDRWFHYLSPSVQPHPWTPEEDLLLLDRVRACGPKWVRIGVYFPTRTDIQLKNRYLVLSRRKKKDLQALERESAAPLKFAPPFSSPFSCDSIPPLRARTPQDLARLGQPCQDQAAESASRTPWARYPLPSLVSFRFD
jgi:hypothetical protein